VALPRLTGSGRFDTVARVLPPEQVIHVSRRTNGDVNVNSMAFEAPYSRRDV